MDFLKSLVNFGDNDSDSTIDVTFTPTDIGEMCGRSYSDGDLEDASTPPRPTAPFNVEEIDADASIIFSATSDVAATSDTGVSTAAGDVLRRSVSDPTLAATVTEEARRDVVALAKLRELAIGMKLTAGTHFQMFRRYRLAFAEASFQALFPNKVTGDVLKVAGALSSLDAHEMRFMLAVKNLSIPAEGDLEEQQKLAEAVINLFASEIFSNYLQGIINLLKHQEPVREAMMLETVQTAITSWCEKQTSFHSEWLKAVGESQVDESEVNVNIKPDEFGAMYMQLLTRFEMRLKDEVVKYAKRVPALEGKVPSAEKALKTCQAAANSFNMRKLADDVRQVAAKPHKKRTEHDMRLMDRALDGVREIVEGDIANAGTTPGRFAPHTAARDILHAVDRAGVLHTEVRRDLYFGRDGKSDRAVTKKVAGLVQANTDRVGQEDAAKKRKKKRSKSSKGAV